MCEHKLSTSDYGNKLDCAKKKHKKAQKAGETKLQVHNEMTVRYNIVCNDATKCGCACEHSKYGFFYAFQIAVTKCRDSFETNKTEWKQHTHTHTKKKRRNIKSSTTIAWLYL